MVKDEIVTVKMSKQRKQQIIAKARELYAEEGQIEIDDNARFSSAEKEGGDGGTYVQAWVWIDYSDLEPQP